ncbi:N-acetylmuramidase family protein [Modicisalibacter sp. MOD 31.J]|uniref:N-acetylmuramidase domain-containing protein n=1 Tax=Modicisalibacter sp. MOD 31.J TaxID=2831897 RepID=UPI001CCB2F2A|nr:N-acetylmuramidase family protein [Modicisalibacter sp. MOD 31.J]MBZ9576721.1 N-acetylmuramidase family protein [Modicisalibacter sp. MOD 31.J]
MILRHGDHGYRVTSLQQDLARAGHAIEVDGWFGDQTEVAVRAEQRRHGLVVDGLAGPKTRAALQGRPLPKTLKQVDLEQAADRLDVDLAAVMAVNEVESRGRGFFAVDRPAILYERHIMRRRLRLHGIPPEPIARLQPDLVNRRPGGYVGGIAEWQRLDRARDLDDASALESCSWGLFQIMGYHWHRLGYASIHAFVANMQESESSQLEAFVRFIEADPTLHDALRGRHWTVFAERYNGPAYAKHDYDSRLAAAARRHALALQEELAA